MFERIVETRTAVHIHAAGGLKQPVRWVVLHACFKTQKKRKRKRKTRDQPGATRTD